MKPLILTILTLPIALTIHNSAGAVSVSKHTAPPKPVVKVKSVVKPTVALKPTVVPAPVAVVPVTYASGCSTYQSTFAQYNWDVTTALAICQAESGGDPYAVSATNDYGLMQLHNQEIFNPYDNIAAAYKIYLEQGWEAWSTFKSNAYAEFL